jgi:hypothetical protein
MPTATAAAPQVSMQGIQIPASSVQPQAFQQATRRQNLLAKTIASFAGFGSTDLIPMLQTGIISHVNVRVFGTLTVTPGSGTVASTYQWPYNIARAIRFTANGQSNLINLSGWGAKLIALSNREPTDDRGVTQGVGGASPGTPATQGTLALASESWGVGQGVTAIPAGNYDVELLFDVPVAYDPISLMGAIFAQTASTDLELAIDWNNLNALFVLTGNGAVTFTPSAVCEATVYTIPGSANGGILIPNLSAFHSVVESRAPNNINNGNNEITLAGQGVGRQLMRLFFRTWNGTQPNQQPLQQNAANYQSLYWRYGGNTTPEQFVDGRKLRQWDEDLYNCDIGALQGYGAFDFSSLWAPRDSIDEGAATQLRFGYSIGSGVTLVAPYAEYIQQCIIAGAVAA